MSTIWAVAKQMIAEGIRMKIALVLLALVGLAVVGIPFSISRGGPLTEAVQKYLAYSFGATGFVLSLLTIFMSRSLSNELVQRHVFLVLTKPVPRWQFLLGKWVGMTLLNVSFLTFSGGVVYGMVHVLRHVHPPIDETFDKAELENEVLVARHALKTRLPDFSQLAEQELQKNIEEGAYSDLLEFNAAAEKATLLKKYEARWRVVGPMDSRIFEFDRVYCDRSPKEEIQIRYKTEVSNYAPDEIFRAVWRVGDPRKGTPAYELPVRHVVGRRHTVRIPADAVAPDHTVFAQFYNQNPFQGEPQAGNVIEFRRSDEVELLFVVGSFEGNLVRLLIMMACKLMFLAAVSLGAAAIFSFPVACLVAFTVYVVSGAAPFINDSLEGSSDNTVAMFASVKEFSVRSMLMVMQVLGAVAPNFPRFDAVETLVNGRNVSLVWVLQAVTDLVLFRSVLVLGLAMLVFQRREVAEVSL